jgi:hypothetical protein
MEDENTVYGRTLDTIVTSESVTFNVISLKRWRDKLYFSISYEWSKTFCRIKT